MCLNNDSKLMTINRTGTNNMLGVKNFKENKIDRLWFYTGGDITLSVDEGYSFGKFEEKFLNLLIATFIKKVDLKKVTSEDLIMKMEIKYSELAQLLGKSSKQQKARMRENVEKACDNLYHTVLKTKDKGADGKFNTDEVIPFISYYRLGIRGKVIVQLAPVFAEYISKGHLLWLPSNVFKLNGEYDFAIAVNLFVEKRMNGNKKGSQEGSINIDTLINKIDGIKNLKSNSRKTRSYQIVDEALGRMIDYKILDSFEYKNNKVSENGENDYLEDYKLLEGDTIIFKVPKDIAEEYK